MTRSCACSLVAFALPVLLLGAVACSSSNNNSGTKTTNTASSASASAAAVTPRAQVGGTPGAAPAIVELATDPPRYAVTTMAAPAGQPLTVIVQNQGAIHNWHLVGVKDAAGKDIATPLQHGPTTFNVTFTITTPGTYHFMCDADPATMQGTLTIH
jgi:plastocyanin